MRVDDLDPKKLADLLYRAHDIIWLNCVEPIDPSEAVPLRTINAWVDEVEPVLGDPVRRAQLPPEVVREAKGSVAVCGKCQRAPVPAEDLFGGLCDGCAYREWLYGRRGLTP
ncbi:MAG TPA: hypothetical protein VEI97_09855 [bacterium]|nr:hypothetical protein [bacterium]